MSAPEIDAPFSEPWQAQAFAMAVHLNEKSLFTWSEWAEAFGRYRASDGDYWEDWLACLEEMTTRQQLCSVDQLSQLKSDWEAAYETTPHGQVVTLAR